MSYTTRPIQKKKIQCLNCKNIELFIKQKQHYVFFLNCPYAYIFIWRRQRGIDRRLRIPRWSQNFQSERTNIPRLLLFIYHANDTNFQRVNIDPRIGTGLFLKSKIPQDINGFLAENIYEGNFSTWNVLKTFNLSSVDGKMKRKKRVCDSLEEKTSRRENFDNEK